MTDHRKKKAPAVQHVPQLSSLDTGDGLDFAENGLDYRNFWAVPSLLAGRNEDFPGAALHGDSVLGCICRHFSQRWCPALRFVGKAEPAGRHLYSERSGKRLKLCRNGVEPNVPPRGGFLRWAVMYYKYAAATELARRRCRLVRKDPQFNGNGAGGMALLDVIDAGRGLPSF